jgi:hypothetical protein
MDTVICWTEKPYTGKARLRRPGQIHLAGLFIPAAAMTRCDYRHCGKAPCDARFALSSAGPILPAPALGPTLSPAGP